MNKEEFVESLNGTPIPRLDGVAKSIFAILPEGWMRPLTWPVAPVTHGVRPLADRRKFDQCRDQRTVSQLGGRMIETATGPVPTDPPSPSSDSPRGFPPKRIAFRTKGKELREPTSLKDPVSQRSSAPLGPAKRTRPLKGVDSGRDTSPKADMIRRPSLFVGIQRRFEVLMTR